MAISASMCRAVAAGFGGGFLDRDYYDDVVGSHFRDGTIAEAPVLPGTGMFMPAGSAAWKDKGLFRRDVPEFNAERCTGCMECALVCPDAAIPNTVHEIHDLLLTAIEHARHLPTAQREAMRTEVFMPAPKRCASAYRKSKDAEKPFHEIVADAARRWRRTTRCCGATSAGWPMCWPTSRGQHAAVLRRHGEGKARQRRPVLRQHRPVEVQRLPGMRRGLRTRRAGRAAAGRRVAEDAADALRVPQQDAEHAGALRQRRHAAPTATPSG